MDPLQLLDPLDLCVYCAYQCLAYNTTELDLLFGSYVHYKPSCYSNCTVTNCVFLCVLIKTYTVVNILTTGASHLSRTAVKPDSHLAQIFCIMSFLYNLINLMQISTDKPDNW